jgi:hypothetical protein
MRGHGGFRPAVDQVRSRSLPYTPITESTWGGGDVDEFFRPSTELSTEGVRASGSAVLVAWLLY